MAALAIPINNMLFLKNVGCANCLRSNGDLRSNYKGLGALTKKALKYIKTEWSAMQTILQDGNLELSNNLAEQMMRHIKLNLKNCLNIGSEDSALDYAFMFSVIESCNMNKLSPGCYIKELVSRLTAKPVCTAEKVALLPCFMQK